MRPVLVLASLAAALAACVPENDARTPAFLAAPDAGTATPKQDARADADLANDPKQLFAKVESLAGELKSRPRDFHINVALGTLYYDNGRYIDAIGYFRDALAQATEAEKQLLALRAAGKLPVKTPAPEACRSDLPDERATAAGQKLRALETIVAEAKQRGATPEADACWAQALPHLALVHAKRGNSFYLVGNPDQAKVDHAAALALDPDHPEALFFSGALTLETAKGDPAKMAQGKAFWQHLIDVAPDHPRANLVRETLPRIEEIFGARPNPMAAHGSDPHANPHAGAPAADGPAPLDPNVVAAFQNQQLTPEVAKGLDDQLANAEKLLAESKWQEALDAAKPVMPMRPDGRVALIMGVALRELGKPTAERVLMQATRMPGGDPARARLELARFYAKAERVNEAKALLAELAADAKWGADAKALLAKLP